MSMPRAAASLPAGRRRGRRRALGDRAVGRRLATGEQPGAAPARAEFRRWANDVLRPPRCGRLRAATRWRTAMNVASKDGTTIGFDRTGAGPPVVLVCGGSVDRMANAELASLLAADFTVLNYDRRGRGDSGDTAPYAVEREFEDLDAVIEAA